MDTVVVEQFVPAPPGAVQSAFLDAGELARWWWPHLPAVGYDVDGEEGGTYRIRTDAIGIGVHGEFTMITPAQLVMTWVWEDGPTDGPTEIVTIDFEETGGGQTNVRVTHPCEDDDNLRRGWTDVLERLGRLF